MKVQEILHSNFLDSIVDDDTSVCEMDGWRFVASIIFQILQDVAATTTPPRSDPISSLSPTIISNQRSYLQIHSSSPHRCRRGPSLSETQKRRNITMAMILAFTTVDKMAHNSRLREEYNGLKTTITARQIPTAFTELHALLSDHDYMLRKTRAPAPSITSSFAANYAVGSPSMPKARQAQLSELTAQLSSLGFQVSPIAPSGP
ncbi:hypothetical protein Tco_0865110 [Tanacetum coccineum]